MNEVKHMVRWWDYIEQSILACIFLGSFEMNKLRLAIMGKKGKNLDDLCQMDRE